MVHEIFFKMSAQVLHLCVIFEGDKSVFDAALHLLSLWSNFRHFSCFAFYCFDTTPSFLQCPCVHNQANTIHSCSDLWLLSCLCFHFQLHWPSNHCDMTAHLGFCSLFNIKRFLGTRSYFIGFRRWLMCTPSVVDLYEADTILKMSHSHISLKFYDTGQ